MKMRTKIARMNELSIVRFYEILLDFDYVEKMEMVNGDDHVGLISIYRNEFGLNVRFRFHYFLSEIELIFYKHLSSMLMKQLAMSFYHYVVIVVLDFENNVHHDDFLTVAMEIDVFSVMEMVIDAFSAVEKEIAVS